MKTLSIFTFIFFCSFIITIAQNIPQELIYGNWYVTYLENKGDTLVCRKYASAPYDWGTTYTFNRDSTFINSLTSIEDTANTIRGKWEFDKVTYCIHLHPYSNKVIRISIISLSKNIMQIKILKD